MSINDEDRNIIIKAIEAARHSPKLIGGQWWLWDFDNGEYKNTGSIGSFEESITLNETIIDVQNRLAALESAANVRSAIVDFLTQGDYDALRAAGLVDAKKLYFITNEDDSIAKMYIGADFMSTRLSDGAKCPASFPGGLEFGQYVSGLSGAMISASGAAELQSLLVRGPLITNEVIFNRISAQEGDNFYSENGTINSVTLLPDGTYNVFIHKRFDNDFLSFKEGDIIYGETNNIIHSEGSFVSWMRVLSVDTVKNSINVVMYHDDDVPGGKNHSPISHMRIARRGNAFDTERQSYWYLSATSEKCLIWLEGVSSPILNEGNYFIMIGRPKNLSIFDNLPINYSQSYIYARGAIFQDIFRVDFAGNPVQSLIDRGFWSIDIANSEGGYICSPSEASTVWHLGCRWKCLKSGTTQEPKYSSTDWAMIEGNPNFSISIDSSNGWVFNHSNFKTTLFIRGTIYNQDVTEDIRDDDVIWTRDTGDIEEDNAWAVSRASAGKSIDLTTDDLGPHYTTLHSCTFRCQALLRDGQKGEDYVTF
ncbi:MAG: hypothetical protein ACI4TU_06980 [Candidatus Cryptobacteroides sp.]